MKFAPYLSFQGDCERAFQFYEHCFGGKLGPLFRFAGTPMAEQVPKEWADKIMHGSVSVAGYELMGADVLPSQFETPKGFTLSIQLQSTSEAKRIFAELAKEGEVVVALQKTFWIALFGQVIDRFHIPWMINCG